MFMKFLIDRGHLEWKLLGVYVFNRLRAFLSFVPLVSYCWSKFVAWTDIFILIDHNVLRLELVSLDYSQGAGEAVSCLELIETPLPSSR